MSQSNDNKVVEGVVDSTLTKSNLLSKVVENKNILYLSLGLLGCIAVYKNRNTLLEGFKKLYSKDEKDEKDEKDK